MNKLMIIGCGGSGKSALAVRLGQALNLPVLHLDRLFWRPGWKETPKQEWRARQEELCRRPQWIMDGNYGGSMDVRLAACDTVIFLDLPTASCLAGALRRFLNFRGRSRPDVADGCPERLSWDYLKWIWDYRRTRRPGILKKLEQLRGSKQVVILTSRRAVRRFMQAGCLSFDGAAHHAPPSHSPRSRAAQTR